MTASVLRVAHRAGNDIGTMLTAAADGADLVEADVHLRRGALEIRHTKTLGPLPWLWDRWYLVPAGRPRLHLDELVTATPPGVRLMLDLKGWQPWLGQRTAAVMEQVIPGTPYAVCSRHWRMLDVFHPLSHVDVVYSARTQRELGRLRRRLPTQPAWGVALHRDLLTPTVAAELLARVDVVLTWPCSTAEEVEQVVRLGATAVIRDAPAVTGSAPRAAC